MPAKKHDKTYTYCNVFSNFLYIAQTHRCCIGLCIPLGGKGEAELFVLTGQHLALNGTDFFWTCERGVRH